MKYNQFSKHILILIATVLILTLSGCSPSGQTDENTPDSDSSEPESLKIISLSPSQTETLFALGLEDAIIGVSDYCDYPEEAMQKENLGSSWTINLERVIELVPDIVFVYGESHAEALDQIKASGIEVVNLEPETVESVFESILLTGELTGKTDKANEIVEEMRKEKQSILEKVSNQTPIPVFYQVWDEPLQTAGPDSFIHELITLAGGDNIAKDAEGSYPMYSVEALIEKNPEIYFMPPHVSDFESMTEEMAESIRDEVRNRPGFDQITAIKENRIELLEPNIASRPGVRIIQGLRAFAEAMHPEVF